MWNYTAIASNEKSEYFSLGVNRVIYKVVF